MPRFGVAVVALALALPHTSVADVYVDGADRGKSDSERCATEGGIVGRRNCPPYGTWGAALEAPYVIIRIGVNMRHIPRVPIASKDLAARASSSMGTQTGVQLPPEAAADSSYSIAEQISISMNRFMYLGFEVEISPRRRSRSLKASVVWQLTRCAGGHKAAGRYASSKLELESTRW